MLYFIQKNCSFPVTTIHKNRKNDERAVNQLTSCS